MHFFSLISKLTTDKTNNNYIFNETSNRKWSFVVVSVIKLTVTNEWLISVNGIIVGFFAPTSPTLYLIKYMHNKFNICHM